jgi:uncharacterized protein
VAVAVARVGLGFRPELAAGILAHRDRIDLVEVIAEDYFEASRAERRALRTLAGQVPIVLHGVSLGLASSALVETHRLEAMARLVDELQPEFWSEHLAFVRAGGREIGHLAAPPRSNPSLEGLLRNVETARRVVGAAPLLENVASLLDPPGSDRDEATWLREVAQHSGTRLLLDLHNLHANGVNFGWNPAAVVAALPEGAVGAVHLAGGRWITAEDGSRRLLDDHLHDVPPAVFELLGQLTRGLDSQPPVILERDGRYPEMAALLQELEAARAVMGAAVAPGAVA